MKVYIVLIFFCLTLNAQNSEERFFKDKNAHANGFALHTDMGYGSYLIELDSSELNAAIDYDVLEFTLGTTYSYDRWLWGVYGKFLLKELESNMFVVTTHEKLGNHSKIDKNEFGVYVNYRLMQREDENVNINFIYRYSDLRADDSYQNFYTYSSMFDYKSSGLALSLVYLRRLDSKSSWFTQAGLLYSKAEVKMSESVNGNFQDAFVEDEANAWGGRVGLGYSYALTEQLFLTLRADAWRLDFSKLNVSSHVGDTLPKAELREDSFTSYAGFSWRF